MPVVTMPDGVPVTFPDEMPAEQIKSLIATKFPDAVKGLERKEPSLLGAVRDIPSEAYNATAEAISTAASNLNPFSEERKARVLRGENSFIDTGKGLLAAASVPMAPIVGAARSLIGQPLALATPTATPEEQQKLRAAGMPQSQLPGASAAENYEKAKGAVDLAMMGMGARGGLVRSQPPAPPAPNGPLGVTLSEGQATRDLAAIQREQAALRAPSGRAGERAQDFAAQQAAEVASARERISQGFDPFNQRIVETPQEAGQLVQQSVQQAAAARKAGVDQAYAQAKAMPGEIEAGAFKDISTAIKTDLSARPDPIVIDDKLTPFASHAIRDVEQRIANMQIQNRASPTGQPPQNQIAGITLEGVDQMRKRLVAFRRDAYGSGNAADGRAARGVVEAFDNHIDNAINSGQFVGDQRAIKAWNDARAAHADYRATFGKGRNDPVGRVVERILGTRDNPAAIPNDVADFLYGGSGINPSSLNVAVANRVKSILGDQSPEWSAVKQGLFSRMVETPAGVTDMGPGKVAQRINKFLADGKEMSEAVFSPLDRSLIKQYADLHRAMEVPQAGANWSNTSTFVLPMLKKISTGLAAVIGGAIGHAVAPGMYGVGEGIGAAAGAKVSSTVKDFTQTRQIAKQMPLVAEATAKFQRALTAYNKSNSPPSSAALQVATANLVRSLRHVGVDLAIEGPRVGRAEDEPDVPRPPGE